VGNANGDGIERGIGGTHWGAVELTVVVHFAGLGLV
jgi:hypothetical protein